MLDPARACAAPGALRAICLLFAALATPVLGGADTDTDTDTDTGESVRPNIVVLLADDLGYSDLGVYGSEIRTPNIDALAAEGMQFGNFHVSPSCAPTRAMLLTGVSSHRAGVGSIPETLPPEHRGQPAYLGRLRDDVVTIAELLRAAGYRTYATGKWHLGSAPGALPDARGFDRSFVLDASGADNWAQQSYLPYYGDAPWFEDGAPARLPDDFYSSAFIVEKMIDYLSADSAAESGAESDSDSDSDAGAGAGTGKKEAVRPDAEVVPAPDRAGGGASSRPFFAFLGFQAVHIPVQAPREFVERYAGVYDAGWGALRRARFDAVRARGLVPADMTLAPMPDGIEAWDSLDADDRALMAKSMAVHAAMVEAMDHHIGGLVRHLRETGELERTLFLVLSDNGAEPNRPTQSVFFRWWLRTQGYRRDLETLGEQGSYVSIGPGFASAASAPGAFFKFQAGEGGVRVPLVIRGPGVEPGMTGAFSFVTDLVPTLLELASVPVPARLGERPVQALTGRSLVPLLQGRAQAVHGDGDVIAVETSGNVALWRGDVKLVRNVRPWGDGQWYLHDIARDPGEAHDLSRERPELKADLLAAWDAWAAREGVLPMPEGYAQMQQVVRSTGVRLLQRNWPWLVAIAVLLVLGIGLALRARRGTA